MCYGFQNSMSGKGAKNTAETQPFPPSEIEREQKFPDPTERGRQNDIEHGLIIRVSTVINSYRSYRIVCSGSCTGVDK